MFTISSKSLVALLAPLSLSLSVCAVGCGSAPAEASGSSGQAMTAAAADPEFTPCAFDSDCVVIPQAGCCPIGWNVAVNADLVCAYNDANACTVKNMMCMNIRVNDTRVAICDSDALACAMVAPESIRCGGDGVNPHSCPGGYDCVLGPDDTSVGTCTKHVDGSSDDAGTTSSN